MKSERDDLLETYRDMTTEELLDHWESGTLTQLAMQIAREELIKRGVDLPPVSPVDEDADIPPVEDAEFETVARSFTPTEMHILRGRLEADGIPAFVVDDNINETNSVLAANSGVRLQVASQYADDAKRIIAEVKSGELTLKEDAPEQPPTSEVKQAPAPNWEILLSGLIFIFASFEFVRTMWFAHTFNDNIEWDFVASLALTLPILFFIGALFLVFRVRWALLCFGAHLLLSIASVIFLTSGEQLQPAQITGWICTAAIIYFCIHLRRAGRLG